MLTIFVILLFVFLFLGFPIFIALMVPSAFFLTQYINLPNWVIPQKIIGGMNKYTLICIPFFILAANVMGKGKLGHKLLNFSRNVIGHFYGGVALTAILACSIIGAISGAGTAGILIIGRLIYDDLIANKYKEDFASGLITTISSVAMLIPPSIPFIIFAINTGTSIARLFLGGFGAGILLSTVFAIYSYIYARINKLPLTKRPSIKELFLSTKEALWALGLPVILLGGMYSGLFSPTEAAAVSSVYAIFVEMIIYKNIKPKDLIECFVKTASTIAIIYVLLGAGNVLAHAMTLARIPTIVEMFLGDISKISILLIINVAFLIAGMFVGASSAIVILIPPFLPLISKAGIDPIHLGVIVVANLAIGMYTPPFGLNLFVSTNVLQKGFVYLVKSVIPFIYLSLFVLLLITLFPQISLWLPAIILK